MGFWETIYKSIILGTVQGLTEFLPVSSSGHLVLLQKVLHYEISGGSMTFVNVMLHLGTLFAVVAVFRKEILQLFKRPYKHLFMLAVATIPAAAAGVFLGDVIDTIFAGRRGLFYLALCFLFTALELLLCEFVAKRRERTAPLGWRSATCMGLMQAVALFPGISRSGSTIAAGTLSGAKAEDVAKFSFLMSVPIILGSVLVESKDMIFPASGVSVFPSAAEAVGVLIGVICAAVSGFFAVKVMLSVIAKANYKWFSLYLVLLSMTCIWLDVLIA